MQRYEPGRRTIGSRLWRRACGLWVALAIGASSAAAAPVSGAIFTALPDGSRAVSNIFAFKSDVYLNGGPGDHGAVSASGLPDGRYVFQVTDTSGKTLLSIDPARCRQFEVSGGVIVRAIPSAGCEHATGADLEHGGSGARSIQVCGGGAADPANPTACFGDAPSVGGEYKVWIASEADYLAGCALLGKSDGLDQVDCGSKNKGNFHGFIPRVSRVDNFKVGGQARSIAVRFYGVGGALLDGKLVTWTDPLGASNNKYSYEAPALGVFHEATIDSVELGSHSLTIADQPGCSVGTVYVGGKRQSKGSPESVTVMFQSSWSDWTGTVFVDVYCR